MRTPACLLIAIVGTTCCPTSLLAQSSALTYQGYLAEGGAPAEGLYDFRFTVFDSELGLGAVAGPITLGATAVSNGVFTVTLDFGVSVFDGSARWLQIETAASGGGLYSTLSPRQPITSAPYAIRAANAGSAQAVTGSVDAGQLIGTLSTTTIAAGSINSNLLAAGSVGATQLADGSVGTMQLADDAVTADKIAGETIAQPLRSFVNPNGGFHQENFSSITAVGENWVLIGASRNETGAGDSGQAYLFPIEGGTPISLVNPNPADLDRFGASVAAVGPDTVIVGSPFDDGAAHNAGAAHLYRTDGTFLSTLTHPAPQVEERMGDPVAGLGPDTVLVCAPSKDTTVNFAGVVYLFNTNGTLVTTFSNAVPQSSDYFGRAVTALGSDRVLIGAPGRDGGLGETYLFRSDGVLLNTYTNPSPSSVLQFGATLTAVGTDRVLIGSVSDEAYLYHTNGTRLATFSNPTPEANDRFAQSMAALTSDTVLIGDDRDTVEGEAAGGAFVFHVDGHLLDYIPNPDPAVGDLFASDFAVLNKDTIVVAAALDDPIDSGAAHLFALHHNVTPGLVAEGVGPDSVTALSIVDGAVTADKVSNLDASSLTFGTLDDARLSANVALLDTDQTFTGSNTFGPVTADAFQLPSAQAFTYNLPGNALFVRDDGETYSRSANGYVVQGAATATISLFGAVHLPQGAVVTGGALLLYDNSLGGNFTAVSGRLRRRAPASTSNENILVFNPSTPPSGAINVVRTLDHDQLVPERASVDNDSYQYWIYADITSSNPGDSSLRIYGFRVYYTLHTLRP